MPSSMRGGGTVVTFELAGGTKQSAFDVLDKLQVIDISNNLGDAKSLMIYAGSNEVQITNVARGLLSD